MLEEMLKNVREKSPLIHNITNYVTVNDCANVVLACGASPIMADDQKEVAEILGISQSYISRIRERLNQWSLLGKKLMNFIIQLY